MYLFKSSSSVAALPSITPTYKLNTFENSPPSENHCLVSPRQQTAKRLMSLFASGFLEP